MLIKIDNFKFNVEVTGEPENTALLWSCGMQSSIATDNMDVLR
jgi:hypothetical protein